MFYVIEKTVSDPEKFDADVIEISTTPARGNSDKKIIIDGWCGSWDDVSTYAHGEFNTIEDARAKIAELNPGGTRTSDDNGSFESQDHEIVETHKPGKYAKMTRAGTEDFLSYWRNAIDHETTDARLEEICDEAESCANDSCQTLHFLALYILQEFRDEKIAELDDLEDIED